MSFHVVRLRTSHYFCSEPTNIRDIIVAADGAPIRSAAQLRNKISLTQVGERLELTLRRKGVVSNVLVEVASAAETTGKVYSGRQQ
jgi:S1-C subfamily serine protease